jgi:transposase-like protein
MRKSRRKLEMDNIVLRIRVQTLENIICPCDQHDWVKVAVDLEGGTGHGDETTIYHYQCKRCLKTITTTTPI